jgi:hypothetical protein
MDRDSDDDGPVLRTREVTKKAPKITQARDAVDTMVRTSPEFPLICSRRRLTLSKTL